MEKIVMYDFVIPKVGMGITEVEIVTWKVNIGDRVSEDDPVVEIDAEKGIVELKSDVAGVVKEIVCQNGDIVEVGSTICRIEVD
jgi:pyruvate dehydrogenase E2 component (dihydrolipoamide acetyltransferase)